MEILLFLINLQVIRIVQKKGRGMAKQREEIIHAEEQQKPKFSRFSPTSQIKC